MDLEMPRSLTLLIVADNPSISHWIKKHLDDRFFILEASNAFAAAEAVKNGFLHFIIVDAALEETKPLPLCKQLRQLASHALTPILLITGRLNKTFRQHALDSGVTDFLSDGLDEEELETRVAVGLKAASMREKTSEVSSVIQRSNRKKSE